MSANTPPIAAPAVAPKKVYERKTRVPDWLTDVVLVLTGIFGIWAVALVVLTFIGILQPAFLYSDWKAAITPTSRTSSSAAPHLRAAFRLP